MLAIIIQIPEAYWQTSTPTTIGRTVGSTPLADTPLLSLRNNLKILLDDKLVVSTHCLVLFLGHISSIYKVAVLIRQAHIQLRDTNQLT